MRFENDISEVFERVSTIAHSADVLDVDEPAPSESTISRINTLLAQAAAEFEWSVPRFSKLSVCYGEINLTWRLGDSIVRLACFPSGKRVVQWGNVSAPMGSYKSADASADLLAQHWKAMYGSATSSAGATV